MIRWIVAGAVLVAAIAYHAYAVRASWLAGQLAERLAWQEQRLKDIAKTEAERKVAEGRIAGIEAKYLADQQTAAIKIADLEKAIADEQADNPACPPAISRRLRDQLEAIGR